MFCKYCGAQNADGAKFCANCGADVSASIEQPTEVNVVEPAVDGVAEIQQALSANATQPAKKFSAMAITGFVLALVGIIFAGLICGTLGVIFSAIGLAKTAHKKMKGKGLAIAGLVVSIIDVVIMIISFLPPV